MDRDPGMQPLPAAFIERFLQTSAQYLSGQQTSTLPAAGLRTHDPLQRPDYVGPEVTQLPHQAAFQTQYPMQIGRQS